MKVILLDDVDNLGHAGDEVSTKEGYFRNYLQPRKLAVLSSEGGLRFLEAKKKKALARSEQEKKSAVELAAQLEKITCSVKARVGQEGKLFGSVTTQDVHDELSRNGISIDRKRIEMAPIHQVGEYHAKVKLHAEVDVTLKVSVKAA